MVSLNSISNKGGKLPKILLTGFGPFGENDINPSKKTVMRLDGEQIKGYEIVGLNVPTIYEKAIEKVVDKIEEIDPEIVISLGLAERKRISLERVAINVNDARIEDNEGNEPVDKLIDEDGPVGYFSTLPIREILNDMKDAGIPTYISNSAGTYVCNNVMYGVLNHIEKNDLDIRAGFIHLPCLPEQALEDDRASMSLDLMIKAVRIAIETTVDSLK